MPVPVKLPFDPSIVVPSVVVLSVVVVVVVVVGLIVLTVHGRNSLV